MAKNLMSGPILACLAEIWVTKILDIVANYHHIQFQGKRMTQTQENGEKPCFGPDLGTLDSNSGRQFFFLKIWLCQSVDIMVNNYHVKYQKKTNDSILKKFTDGGMDGRTDGHTDGQTDESDFIGRCLTDVERPTESEYML